jgi:hypothetical protein
MNPYRWFRRHWFAGVFVIIAGVWTITLIAYAFGAGSVSFGNKFTGQRATIDFMRDNDHVVVGLADGVGLQLDHGGPPLHADIVRLKPGFPVLCWVCGQLDTAGGISMVAYRQGDWFYRAPEDLSRNSEATHGLRAESRAFILTIAYNRANGERVQAGVDVAAQTLALTSRGLAVTDAARISPETIRDLPVLSIQREGCLIFNVAFVSVVLLWLVFGGLAWLLVRFLRRPRV